MSGYLGCDWIFGVCLDILGMSGYLKYVSGYLGGLDSCGSSG